jgi:protocatechuate 3,4-dioxygenase beta subunit
MTNVIAEATPTEFEGRPLPHPDEPVFDQGLLFDVGTLSRRRVLQALGFGAVSAGMFTIVGCQPTGSAASAGATPGTGATAGSSFAAGAACDVIPEETAGPYPGDGTNGPDVLTESGIVRQDIRSSIAGASGVADGVGLTIRLRIVDASKDCAPMAGAAVYLWHCTREGKYSMYSQGVENENFLRGVQATGADGVASFTSVFPGCYSGRWPHIHFEVYPDVASAADASRKIATSQIAMPEETCKQAYGQGGYEASVSNLAQTSLARDMVFGDDGGVHQLGSMSGSISAGLTVDLQVPVGA